MADLTRETSKSQHNTEARTHTAEWGPPITGIGWPAPLVGRPAYGSRLSVSTLLCALHRLCGSFSTVYEGRFQVGSSNGNQGKMTRIDDVAMPCPLHHHPYIRHPLPLLEHHILNHLHSEDQDQEEFTTSELPTHNSIGIDS